ncbi:MAG: hypothetical protein ACRDY3_02300 [Acidimicrobiales bacterium]
MDYFLTWRDSMLHVVDLCRSAASKLAERAPSQTETLVVPFRRQVGGFLSKRSVVEPRPCDAWLLAEWGLARPPAGAAGDLPPEPEPLNRLYLLADGRVVLRRSGAGEEHPLRLVDDADFVQVVHREALSEQLRRRLARIFGEAELSAPFVPDRPRVNHADVWGKVARPGGSGPAPGGVSRP